MCCLRPLRGTDPAPSPTSLPPSRASRSLPGKFSALQRAGKKLQDSWRPWPRGSPAPSPKLQTQPPPWHRAHLAAAWLEDHGEQAARDGPGRGEAQGGSGSHPSPSPILGWASSPDRRARVSDRGPWVTGISFMFFVEECFWHALGKVMGCDRHPPRVKVSHDGKAGHRVGASPAHTPLWEAHLGRAGHLARRWSLAGRPPLAQPAHGLARGPETLKRAPVCLSASSPPSFNSASQVASGLWVRLLVRLLVSASVQLPTLIFPQQRLHLLLRPTSVIPEFRGDTQQTWPPTPTEGETEAESQARPWVSAEKGGTEHKGTERGGWGGVCVGAVEASFFFRE